MKAFDDTCVIRYSNMSFFSVADLTNPNYTSDSNFVTDRAAPAMKATRWRLLSRLAREAAVSESELRFADGSARYNYKDSQGTSQVIYGLAQCTRDLDASECVRCLTTFMEGRCRAPARATPTAPPKATAATLRTVLARSSAS
jgi:hypothetical protein